MQFPVYHNLPCDGDPRVFLHPIILGDLRPLIRAIRIHLPRNLVFEPHPPAPDFGFELATPSPSQAAEVYISHSAARAYQPWSAGLTVARLPDICILCLMMYSLCIGVWCRCILPILLSME